MGVLAQVHFTVGLVGPVGPWPHPIVTSLVPEYIIGRDIFNDWKNPHFGIILPFQTQENNLLSFPEKIKFCLLSVGYLFC